MQDMTAVRRAEGSSDSGAQFGALQRRFPTVAYLREKARRTLPKFAFEYCDGGAGADGGIARNWNALNAVELVRKGSEVLGGKGGGGRPDMAQAGGPDGAKADAALSAIEKAMAGA